MRYRSLVQQTLHYFGRPQSGVRRQPLRGPSAWRSAALTDDWRETLSAAEVAALRAAVAKARKTGKPMGELRRQDGPFRGLEDKIVRWREELVSGRGFLLIRGLPVQSMERAEVECLFWLLGQHLGIPGAQNPDGDLLGHVRDSDNVKVQSTTRAYRTRDAISFHCDAADVVGLLCLRTAKSGGLSRIASSVTVYNAIVARRPDLIDRLYRPTLFDTRSEGGVRYFPVPPCRHFKGELRTFYHSDYFRSVSRHPDVTELEPRLLELLDLYDEIANDPDVHLEMALRPGDIQLLSNHTQIHCRTGYEDHAEPDRKRHLLRLWLSLPRRGSPQGAWLGGLARLRLVGTLLAQRWRQR